MLYKEPSLREIAQLLRSGGATASSLMESCQIAYEQTESHLNAYKTWSGDSAKRVATSIDSLLSAGYDLGPLMGIPISVKDLFSVPNMPTFAGSSRELGEKWQVPGALIKSLMGQG